MKTTMKKKVRDWIEERMPRGRTYSAAAIRGMMIDDGITTAETKIIARALKLECCDIIERTLDGREYGYRRKD